jgi:dTDP-4-amino-4,6-dideoxygalactose transaminase
MDPILEIAKRHGLPVVEDSCQSHGSEYKGRMAGSMGVAGAFSFYPGKNLGAYGEAGAVTTNDGDLAARMRMIRDHGSSKKYYHSYVGWNARMDGFQGAVLSVKLPYLASWNEARRKNGKLYDTFLDGAKGIIAPKEMPYAKHVYHIYAVRVQNRDAVIAALGEKGIGTNIHYPVPIHLQDAYSFLGLKAGTCPVAEKCASEFVSLPMFPELSAEQIEYVCSELRKIVG